MRTYGSALASLLLVATTANGQSAGTFVPVTDSMLQNPDPADWLMWRRTLDLWGYSPLDRYRPQQRRRALKMVWTRALGPGIQEGTPLVYDGVMYFPNPSDLVQALDAATGDLKWEYRRTLPSDLGEYFPVPSINRNLAIYGDTLIDTSADDYLYALDARTGELRWEVQLFDYRRGAQHTSGPIIADGKIVSGRGCEPEGSPEACVIMAHDARTGRELWRRRTIAAPGEPNGDSWGDLPDADRWHVGSWLVPSYDPELDLVFAGTSVTSPAPKFALAGNDKKISLSQLDARSERRHRRDRLVLPTHRRSLGSRSSVRAHARRNGRGARSRGGHVDQSARAQRRTAQSRDRHSRQDRHRLHARPRHGRIPLGAPHGAAKRSAKHRRTHGGSHRKS